MGLFSGFYTISGFKKAVNATDESCTSGSFKNGAYHFLLKNSYSICDHSKINLIVAVNQPFICNVHCLKKVIIYNNLSFGKIVYDFHFLGQYFLVYTKSSSQTLDLQHVDIIH
jgi:hypothetical protein